MNRMQAIADLGLTIADIATIRRAFLRSLALETSELMRSFR